MNNYIVLHTVLDTKQQIITIPCPSKFLSLSLRKINYISKNITYTKIDHNFVQSGGRFVGSIPSSQLEEGINNFVLDLSTADTLKAEQVTLVICALPTLTSQKILVEGKNMTLSTAISEVVKATSKGYLVEEVNADGLLVQKKHYSQTPIYTAIFTSSTTGKMIPCGAAIRLKIMNDNTKQVTEKTLNRGAIETDYQGYEHSPSNESQLLINRGGMARYVHIFESDLEGVDLNCNTVYVGATYYENGLSEDTVLQRIN